MKAAESADLSYLILTGGSSSRFGSDKAGAVINGVTMLDRLTSAFPCQPLIIGPEIQGGPAAAIVAGLGAVSTPWVAVVAVDMPFAARIIEYLVALVVGARADGFVPVDAAGKDQWLCGVYRTAALKVAVSGFDPIAGEPLHKVMSCVDLQRVQVPDELLALLIDVDTPVDLERAHLLAQELMAKEEGIG
jgi:molybdopterin-guanine dinucleotide biosynthesis protein A